MKWNETVNANWIRASSNAVSASATARRLSASRDVRRTTDQPVFSTSASSAATAALVPTR